VHRRGGTQMKISVRYLVLFFLIYFLILILFIQFVRIGQGIQEISFTLQTLQEEIEKIEVKLKDVKTRLDKIEDELNKWSVYEATAYAPLDPKAKEGMCYEGDPRITASGAPVVPGITVAAGKELPFGTELYIKGIGKRIVQDRGGAIGRGQIDIAMNTQAEAFQFGRRYVLVKILN
jgi:3D (Asp-Asp-Asp) domain-containing protein